MISADPYKLGYLASLVKKASTEYRSVAPQLYQGAAEGLGFGSTDSAVEQVIRLPLIEATLPEVPNKGDVSPSLTPLQPRAVTVTGRTFRARMEYYWEDVQDDKWGYWDAQATEFGKSVERTIEVLAHEIFNRAFDASFPGGWDNLTLANANHQLMAGGTYDNTLPAQPPSETLLEQILDYGMNIPSEYGWPSVSNRVYIITGDTYARRWAQILNSPTAIAHPYNTSTTANQNPAIKPLITSADGRVTIVSAPYLENKDWQFALYEGHELFFFRRWMYEDMEELKDPRAIVHYRGLRVVNGWVDARKVLVIGA